MPEILSRMRPKLPSSAGFEQGYRLAVQSFAVEPFTTWLASRKGHTVTIALLFHLQSRLRSTTRSAPEPSRESQLAQSIPSCFTWHVQRPKPRGNWIIRSEPSTHCC